MQLAFDFPVRPEYSFANFVRCCGNETAFAFAFKLLGADSEENLLYLHGDTGSGKTHLLSAIGQEISAAAADSIPVTPVKDLDPDNFTKTFSILRRYPALLLDDLHLLADDSSLRVALWQLFNDFHESGRKIVATANLPPKLLTSLDEHLQSRFMWGLVAKLDISDDDSRRMIVRKLAEDRQILLPDEVTSHLLVNLPRDIPSLTAALDLIKHHSFATGRKISLRLAREALTQASDLHTGLR